MRSHKVVVPLRNSFAVGKVVKRGKDGVETIQPSAEPRACGPQRFDLTVRRSSFGGRRVRTVDKPCVSVRRGDDRFREFRRGLAAQGRGELAVREVGNLAVDGLEPFAQPYDGVFGLADRADPVRFADCLKNGLKSADAVSTCRTPSRSLVVMLIASGRMLSGSWSRRTARAGSACETTRTR
jgi:hypothetical protein